MKFYFHQYVRFCPHCGCENLKRDHPEHIKTDDGTEWLCELCGFSFKITRSKKWDLAQLLHKEHRSMRTGKMADGISDETRKEFEKNGSRF